MSFNSTPFKPRPARGQPGSTPFRSSTASRFRSSLVPTSRPSLIRRSNPPTKPVSTSIGGRDLFRTSTPRSQRTTEFAPDLPAEATRQPASVRKFAPRKSVSTGMANTSSTEPFKMRIPSPGPDLSGRLLAKEVPHDPNRKGSAYADQYLADRCPAHYDEVQRRQFFCILDLRRLKYTADEIFAQKDWKLNILNFAKEYEKSRGLIMLRYGLYEFKNVKPSNEVLKKWRAAHGLPSEPEDDQSPSRQSRRTPGPSGSVKRKAEEELVPKDNALTASTANQNKRRNLAQESVDSPFAVPAPFKSKRKADDTEDLDENKPSKQQKSTPSAATTFLENILNSKPRNGAASPSKQSSQATSLFGISKTKDSQNASSAAKANPFEQGHSSSLFSLPKANSAGSSSASVLSGHKIGSTPENTGNIFRYMSASPSSSSDDEDDNVDDHKSERESEQNSEEQSPSAGITTSTSTPPVHNQSSPFVVDKTNNTSDIFGRLPKPASQNARGGLFGRVQLGANGQPVRANPSADKKPDTPVNHPPTTKEQAAKAPAKTPGDYTFNPATTPISFGQPAVNVSESSGTKDTSQGANSDTSVPKKAVSIFGASSQVGSGSKPNAPSLFGVPDSAKPKSAEPPVSIFTSQKPTLTSTSIFGAASTANTAKVPPKTNEQTNNTQSTTERKAVSIFDKPSTSASTASETNPHLSNKTTSSTPVAKSQVPDIFDKSFIANNAAQAKALLDNAKPSLDLFSRNSNPLFGAAKDAKSDTKPDAKPEAKADVQNEKANSNIPSTTKGPAPNIFDKSFIASNAAHSKMLSSSSKPTLDLFSRNSNPLFSAPKGNGTSSADTKSNNIDQGEKQVSSTGTSNNKPVEKSKNGNQDNTGSVLGLKPLTPTPPAASIFGAPASSKSAAPTSSIFGEKKAEETTKPATNIFNSAPAANASIFGFASQPKSNSNTQPSSIGSGTVATPKLGVSFGTPSSHTNGAGSNKLSFEFGSSTPGAGSTSFTFGQDTSSSGFTFSAGASKQAVNNPFTTSQSNSQSLAPVFGEKSAIPKPSSSFTFGQQTSSTPKATPSFPGGSLFGSTASSTPKAAPSLKGMFGSSVSSTPTAGPPAPQGPGLFGSPGLVAPSLSFTQASPSQNPSGSIFPNPSASFSSFGLLQASDGSTVANSSFPAPSSLGTTPVNGTPEPQSPRADGEEAVQGQITLTGGGPGEEDETILHEVRAKVLKFIPVDKRDEDKQTAPWVTQGVGPLRVLRNKTTGTVRIVLRAEPRGHIAINKTILADMEYKAKDKTINFVAASEDGSGLETWLLQVKKPDFAVELAGVLEANKSANKQ